MNARPQKPVEAVSIAKVVELFERMLEIEMSGDWERREPHGRRRQHMNLANEIFAALDVPVWERTPIHCDRPAAWVERHPELLQR